MWPLIILNNNTLMIIKKKATLYDNLSYSST